MDMVSLGLDRIRHDRPSSPNSTLEQVVVQNSDNGSEDSHPGLSMVFDQPRMFLEGNYSFNPRSDRNVMEPLAKKLSDSYRNFAHGKKVRQSAIHNIIGAYADQNHWNLEDRFANVRQVVEGSDLTKQELETVQHIHETVMVGYKKRIKGKGKADNRNRILDESDKIGGYLKRNIILKKTKSSLPKITAAATLLLATSGATYFLGNYVKAKETTPAYTNVFMASELPASLHAPHSVETNRRGSTNYSRFEWGRYVEFKTGHDSEYVREQIGLIYDEAERSGRNPAHAVSRAIIKTGWFGVDYNRQQTPGYTRKDLTASIFQTEEELKMQNGFLFRVIETESDFNVRAVSDKGAQGLGQLMPGTQGEVGVSKPFDPFENIEGSGAYLNRMLIRFNGDENLALAAYNGGPRNIRQRYSNNKGIQAYVKRVNGDKIEDPTALSILRDFTRFANSNLHEGNTAGTK